jgi:hypothetical protein
MRRYTFTESVPLTPQHSALNTTQATYHSLRVQAPTSRRNKAPLRGVHAPAFFSLLHSLPAC